MQEDFLRAYADSPIQAPVPQGPGVLGRAAYYGLTAFPTLAKNVTNGIENLTGQEPTEWTPTGILPGTSTAERVTDFVGGGLLPMGLEIGLTGKAMAPITALTGLSKIPLAKRIVDDAAAFGALGLSSDRTTGLEQTGEGALYGALTALPRSQRIIPAALLALGSKLFFDRNGEENVAGNFSQGDVAGGAGFLTSFLPGQLKGAAHAAPLGPLTDHFVPAEPSPYLRTEGPDLPVAQPGPYVPPVARRMYQYPDPTVPMPKGNEELFASIANQQAGYPAAESADAIIESLLPKKSILGPLDALEPRLADKNAAASGTLMQHLQTSEVPLMQEAPLSNKSAKGTATELGKIQSAEDRASLQQGEHSPAEGRVIGTIESPTSPTISGGELKGIMAGIDADAKLRPLPKTGGFVMPELNAALSRAAVGGLIGGGIGGLSGQDNALTGAMIGAAAATFGPELARTFVRKLSTHTITPPSGTSTPNRWLNLAKNFGQTVDEASGAAMATSSRASDRIIRWFDKNLGLTMPVAVKESLLQSKGMASALLDTMDNALTKISLRFKPEPDLITLSNKFLDESITYDKTQYMADVQAKFPNDPQAKKYADFVSSARETVNGLQRMVAEGIGEPGKAKMINDSIGTYLTRSYKIFTNPNFIPDPQSIHNLATEMLTKNVWKGATYDDLVTGLNQYVREVKQSKGMMKGAAFGGNMGQMVAQSVLKERKDLSDAWKIFLGEITDPTERVYQTVFRLRPMAEASKYFNELAKNVKEDGWLPHYFNNYTEHEAFKNKLLQELQNAPNDTERAMAQAKLTKFNTKWEGSQMVDNHPKFGELKNGIVTRNVWDSLRTYDSMTDAIKSPLLRSIVGFHTAIKLGRTALNPITTIRNYLTAPMFAMIAKAGVGDINEAMAIMKDINHPLRKEIMQQGIGNVDQVKTEFYKEFENLTGGKYNFGTFDGTALGLGKFDLDMAEKYVRRGTRNILDIYRVPDNAVRIGSYLSAKRRFAEQLGKALDDPEVMQKATEFTNRYTMNYDAVAPAIKTMRQLPFFNLFLSYTAEMTRILKNLTVDVLKGSDGVSHDRLYAAAPLAMLAVIPEMIQSASESELSEKDRADWEKAKALMPEYSRTRYRGGIKRGKNGVFEYTDFTPLIATDSINQMIRALASGDMEAAASVNPLVGMENTPVLNMITSQMVGKDLHTKREFRGMGDRFANIAKETLPPWFPGIGAEAQKFAQAYTTNATGESGTTNLRTGARITPQDFWQPYWSGVRNSTTNLDVLKQRAISEAKQEIANETAYLNDVLRSDNSPSVKQQAIEKFRSVVLGIQGNLRQQIETP